jgi:hypothetical protein
MRRAAVIRRSVLGSLIAIACGTAFVGVALAVKPTHGAHFTGRTSASPVLGFYAPVKFTVAQDGRSLREFSFGSFGCFGAGGFRPGVNPYTGSSILHVGTIKVSDSGRFSVSGAKSRYTVAGQTTVTTIAVTGRFTGRKLAAGSITFSQKVTGTALTSCGPGTIQFSASSH